MFITFHVGHTDFIAAVQVSQIRSIMFLENHIEIQDGVGTWHIYNGQDQENIIEHVWTNSFNPQNLY